MKIKYTLLTLAAISGASNASTISVNFAGTGGTGANSTIGPADVAGVEAVGNWNNIVSGNNTGTNATTSNLNNNFGLATTVDVTYNQNFWSINNGTSNNGEVHSGYTNTPLDANATISLAQLGTEFTDYGYNVIVYLGGTDGQGVNTAIEVGANIGGGTSQWIRHVRPTEGTFPGLSSTTFSSEALANTSTSNSNYIVFTGLTASSFDLNVLKDSSSTMTWARAGIKGIQIVAIPEPSSVALLGLGGLALIRRRRKD